MAKTEHYFTRFSSDKVYHVFNRSVHWKPMFLSPRNHVFFIKRYHKYLSPVVRTYSYALCHNHFHFGIKIKSIQEIDAFIKKNKQVGKFKSVHDVISNQFRIFFLSYTKAFNKAHRRMGTLFQKPFKRCEMNSENRVLRMILYHHANPQRHKLCEHFQDFRWTSYRRYLMKEPSMLPKSEVFDMFGGKSGFIEMHKSMSNSLLAGEDWF